MNHRLMVPRSTATPDALAWRTAVIANGGSVSVSTFNAVNTFTKSINAAGIRDRFYRLNPFAGTGLSAALVPLYRGPVYGGTAYGDATDTNNNFVSGDYSETSGLTGNGLTKYLANGLLNSSIPAAAGNYHQSVYLMTSGTGGVPLGSYWFAATDATQRQQWETTRTGNTFLGRNTASSSPTDTVPALFTGSRTANNSAFTYRNGTPGTEVTSVVTVTQQAIQPLVCARNLLVGDPPVTGITPTTYFDGRIGGYSMGLGMSAAQVLAYSNAMAALMTAIGRTA